VREAGDAALLAELPERMDPMTNAAVLRLAERIRGAGARGVRDVVPAIRSVAVFFDPLHTDVEALRALLAAQALEPDMAFEGRRHEIPVSYGGEWGVDLEDVAASSGLSVEDVIARHTGRDYRVYMLGFQPGFAYLGTLPPELVARRRAQPRVAVAGGTVGVAGRLTGVYPREAPGGWALIGRTGLSMFDPSSRTPARLLPGDRVRFVATDEADPLAAPVTTPAGRATVARPGDIEVQRAGLLTTVQDTGRWGHQAVGVSVSGALDLVSHRAANALVGNESTAATLEVTIAGPELLCRTACVVAVTGADLSPHVDGRRAPLNQPLTVGAGSVLGFGPRQSGARAYVGWGGGLDVPPTLGSRCTDIPSGLGGLSGRALREGDHLWLAPRGPMPQRRLEPVRRGHRPGGVLTLRILPGPQAGRFPAGAFDQLQRLRFVVSPFSNRMGFRLTGAAVAPPEGEMVSDVAFPGGLQVPPSGEPILLMADRQTTGGYAQLAVVISADIPLAGQLAPGDAVEFEATTREAALADLAAQERALQHLEGHAFT